MVRQVWCVGLLVALVGCGGTTAGPQPAADGGSVTDVPVGVDSGGGGTDSGGSGTDTSTGTDTGGGTICGAMLGPCNPVTNTGCTGAMGCYVVAMGTATHLVSMCLMAGTHGAGEACTTPNDCREGFGCLGMPGVCTKLCCGTDNTSCRDETHGGQPGALCAGMVTGLDIRYCIASITCDPYATTGNHCPAAMPVCIEISRDGTTNCIQQNPSAGGNGHGCCAASDCTPGYLCIGPSGGTCTAAAPTGACRRVCNPMGTGADAGTAVCPMGTMCGGITGAAATYGVCVPPMM